MITYISIIFTVLYLIHTSNWNINMILTTLTFCADNTIRPVKWVPSSDVPTSKKNNRLL